MTPAKILCTLLKGLFIIVVFFSFSGCDDPEPSAEEKAVKLLVAGGSDWAVPSTGGVFVDGVDVTQDLFKDFSLKFDKTTFTTTGTSPVWLRQDTWAFTDETATAFVRGQDNKVVKITALSDTELKLTLEWETTTVVEGGGRVRSLAGKHEFILTK